MFNRNKCVLKYMCFPMVFLVGCSTSSNQRVNRMDSVDNRLLEKRIDDLSGKINLIVNDANRLHNEMEEIKTSNKTIQQKIEGLEASISNLNEQILSLRTSAKTPDIAQPPAEETDVEPALPITDSSKPSEVPDSDSEDKLQIKDSDATTNCKVAFGEVKMEDNKSSIETAMQTYNGTTESEVQMQTILVREDGQWKVDADQTMMSMFGGAMGEMIQGLGKAMGEGLKKGMEEIGKSITEGMHKGF